MPEEFITMSHSEIDRLEVIQKAVGKRIKQSKAAQLLGISPRQVRRLVRDYKKQGAKGLVSKKRGISSNRRSEASFKRKILLLVKENYFDFGPKFASEKLQERHDLKISKETLRQWMIEAGMWKAKRQKKVTVHQSRARRSCFGELVQIDGSPHDWFEGRRDKCCLLVFIDDATSRLLQLRFEEAETTFGYFAAIRDYIKQHGRPLAFYNDKHGIFRINLPESASDSVTQFERAMQTLDIKVICANTPQAKGRVERANSTLQDRLVKELRLRQISDIETANAFLPEFMADHNRRFAVEPKSPTNAHREAIPTEAALDLILSLHETRKLSKNLELSYKNEIFQVRRDTPCYAMRHATVTVCEEREGTIHLMYKQSLLNYTRHKKNQHPAPIVDAKRLNKTVDGLIKSDGRSSGHKPSAQHPWRQYERVVSCSSDRSSFSQARNSHFRSYK